MSAFPSRRNGLSVENLESRDTPGAGQLDPTFGTGGLQLIPFAPPAGGYENGRAVAVMTDGRVVIAGESSPSDLSRRQAIVARLSANGQLDLNFGTGGRVAFSSTQTKRRLWTAWRARPS